MKLSTMLQKFCEKQNIYQYCSLVDKMICGDMDCIGIVISEGNSYMEMLLELTAYLSGEGYDDVNCELEAVSVGSLGEDTIVYFPNAKL